MDYSPRFWIAFVIFTIFITILATGCASERTANPDRSTGEKEAAREILPVLQGVKGTVPPVQYQDIDQIKDTIYSLSQEWESNGLACSSTSCTGNFIDTAGNTITIRATIYPGVEEAHAAFEAEKQTGAGFRQVNTPPMGDESYAWQHLTAAELGARKSNLVTVFYYGAASGAATISQIREIAAITMESL